MPFQMNRDGVRVRVRLSPGARQNGVIGVKPDENNVPWLTSTVTAVPENGRANRALLRMLARQWRVARSSIVIVSGQTARQKVLLVRGNPENLLKQLTGWLARHMRTSPASEQ